MTAKRFSRSLSRRLGYLKPARKAISRDDERSSVPERDYGFLEAGGWSRVGRYVFSRTVVRENPLAGGIWPGYLADEDLSQDEFFFFDTETTGLSGGAGNLVFLLGTARIKGKEFECRQIFLADYPGEPEFLRSVREHLASGRLFVSFNGRSFDSQVLKSRFLLNGMSFEMPRQLDLLYWARRLWRRELGDCSLANLERRVLGITRDGDVPGYEVPGIFFSFLRTGNSGLLPLVFRHNLQDVLSLGRLYALVEGILSEPGLEPGYTYTDFAALGRYLLDRRDGRAPGILAKTFAGGDTRSGRSLSLYYKRRRQWREAAVIWNEMAARYEDGAGIYSRGTGTGTSILDALFAHVELAKYYEHQLKDPEKALYWVEKILAARHPLLQIYRSDLLHRRSRLERKLSQRGNDQGR